MQMLHRSHKAQSKSGCIRKTGFADVRQIRLFLLAHVQWTREHLPTQASDVLFDLLLLFLNCKEHETRYFPKSPEKHVVNGCLFKDSVCQIP